MTRFSPFKSLYFFTVLASIACILSGVFPYVPAADAAQLPKNPADIPWNLSALTVTYDNKREVYIAEEEVIITGGKLRLEADYVEFSNITKKAFAQGNVLFVSGGDSIACNAMEIDLSTQTGLIRKGTIYIQKNNFYIHGENIRKTGEFTYSAEKGAITSCPGDRPDWKITGRNVRVTIEGYGFADHATFWARSVPALYTPFLSFPVKLKRQSGLLTPRISSSDRLGFEFEQPFYWAISHSSDATFYADVLSERGVKVAGEYRYVLNEKSKGFMALDFLDDDKIDDGTDASSDYSFSSTPRRTNADRYWFRMKSDQALPNGFNAKLDLDIVSDEDYLLEFTDGFTGYNDINHYFQTHFGRDLDEYDDRVRENSLVVDRSWTQHYFSGRALWYDNVTARRHDQEDTTLQTLPGIEFSGARQQVWDSPFYYSFDTEIKAFFRPDTTDTQVSGRRADVYPKLYLPVTLDKTYHFQPYVGARGTLYQTNDFTDPDGQTDDFRSRGLYDLGADFSFGFSRVFDVGNGFADKIRHQVTPKLSYRFQPDVDQENLPYFDTLDDMEEENEMSWSLAHSFIARTTAHGPNGNPYRNYREFAWFKLYQDYSIKDERDKNSTGENPWSDVYLEAEFTPGAFVTLDTDIAWSPYNSHFTEVNTGLTLWDNRGDRLSTSYRYTMEHAKTWNTRLTAKIADPLTLYCGLEMNLNRKETIESKVGMLLSRSCWGLGLEYKEETGNKQVAFMITLRGIGEFGNK